MKNQELIELYCRIFDFESARKLYPWMSVSLDYSGSQISLGMRISEELGLVDHLEGLFQMVEKSDREEHRVLFARKLFQTKQFDRAKYEFVSLSGSTDDWVRTQAKFGLATLFLFSKEIDLAMQYLDSMRDLSAENFLIQQLLMAQAQYFQQRPECALNLLEHAIVNSKNDRNFYLLAKLVSIRIEIYLSRNSRGMALKDMEFLRSVLPQMTSCRTLKTISQKIKSLSVDEIELFLSEAKSILRSKGVEIDITQSPTLLNLLIALADAQQLGMSKQQIHQTLWPESTYHPLRDDNRIYVTIKRLKTLLQPLITGGEIIFRRQSCYFWNTEVRLTKLIFDYFEKTKDPSQVVAVGMTKKNLEENYEKLQA